MGTMTQRFFETETYLGKYLNKHTSDAYAIECRTKDLSDTIKCDYVILCSALLGSYR